MQASSPIRPPAPADEGETLTTLVGRLVDDSRNLVGAEIALYKARGLERVSRYKSAAIFFVAAGVLALAGLIALLVGLILSLATLIGPLGATAVVVVVVLVAAGILAMIGKSRMKQPILPEHGE
ncbi:phage holin family protein [Sphingomonas sp. GM_Shp_2]|uniref:phage holin family protein n=1 Tax=Sphingomonas sp. GM_Shp_2 TaxID=2937380 RepID=UPI00226AC9AA|nr:phage holin family protein [Sphingomonas sp. GM_Shp_2]